VKEPRRWEGKRGITKEGVGNTLGPAKKKNPYEEERKGFLNEKKRWSRGRRGFTKKMEPQRRSETWREAVEGGM